MMTAEQDRASREAARAALAALEAADRHQAHYGGMSRSGRSLCECCGAVWLRDGEACPDCEPEAARPGHTLAMVARLAMTLAL